MRTILFGLATAGWMVALFGIAAAETYVIDSQIWGHYQEYLRRTSNGLKPGGFAITTDGHGAFYVWCQDVRCMAGPGYGQEARTNCEREFQTECVVFAIRDDIRVAYEVVPSSKISVAPADLDPAPVNTIVVSAARQAEIESYLEKTKSAGRAWAFAIAKDGSRSALASCPTAGSWSGGGACEPVKGAAQELAKREAVKRCGGPAACVLLYVGAAKAANIEIVVQ